jgi:hypothetical protein
LLGFVLSDLADYLPKPTNFSLLSPDIRVDSIGEIIAENLTVLVVYNRRNTIIDQKTRQCEADRQTDQRDNGNPFLFGVNL